MTTVYHAHKLPPVSKEFVAFLVALFPPRPVTAALREDLDTHLVDVGRQEVITYIQRSAGTWNVDASLKQTSPKS